ncbi:MAG: hypothetical protein LBC87_12375 [Fibromonadaceae bacterium]|jgi:hypothetical protein|nr:hypothetical protein [Fibromonadaceae bacterium]
METLLIFIIIAAIQMIAAYNKQKKEAAKKAAQKYTPPPEATEPIPDPLREIREYMGIPNEEEEGYEPRHEPKPALEQELHHSHPHTMIAASPPPKEQKITKYQFDLKDPAHGVLWAAILHEPRYRVKWKQR